MLKGFKSGRAHERILRFSPFFLASFPAVDIKKTNVNTNSFEFFFLPETFLK